MGNAEDGQKYAQRAQNFVNVWNSETTVPDDDNDIVGFMQVCFCLFDLVSALLSELLQATILKRHVQLH